MGTGLKEVFGRSMLRFGSLLTGRFLKDATFTILMGIHSITTSRTWPASVLLSTQESISKVHLDWLRRESISSELDLWLQSGIDQKKGVSGIAATQVRHGVNEGQSRSLVSNVGSSLKALLCGVTIDSALMHVSQNGVVAPGSIMLRSLASDAKNFSPQTSTKRLDSAHANAAGLRLVDLVEVGKANTYSLHIHKQHEYYANGLLVRNCYDTLRYGAMLKAPEPTIIAGPGGLVGAPGPSVASDIVTAILSGL
jgi:hypothetical protein